MSRDRLDRLILRLPPSARRTISPEEPGLDRRVQDHIGAKLRAMYDELRGQPVPERFLELLGHLDTTAWQRRKLDG